MAQTGYTPILIYSSSTTTNAPAAGNLTNSTLGSELAINITDGKLFYKDNANNVQVIAWKTTPTTAGGTGLTSYTAGDMLYYASGTTLTQLAIGATGRWLGSSGTAPQWNAPAALTKTDDTNVTLTLGGSASTALLNAASLTLGWTGTLAVSRGGTGTGTAFTAGSVVFAGASGVYSQDNTNFFWDDANNRLGVLTASPAGSLDIAGQNSYFGDSTNGGRLYFRRGVDGSAVGRVGWISGSNVNFEIANDSGSGKIILQTNSVSRVEIDNAGGTNIKTGNLVIGTSGKGIDFSSSGGDILAYYDEGTWTPVFTNETNCTITYSATRRYTRIGNTVIVNVAFNYTSAGAGPASFVFTLPFTAVNDYGISAIGTGYPHVIRWAVTSNTNTTLYCLADVASATNADINISFAYQMA